MKTSEDNEKKKEKRSSSAELGMGREVAEMGRPPDSPEFYLRTHFGTQSMHGGANRSYPIVP